MRREETKKMWVSKYALTSQVREVDASFAFAGRHKYYHFEDDDWRTLRLGTEIHETKELAEKAASAMRLKRIKSLEKQISQIKAAQEQK